MSKNLENLLVDCLGYSYDSIAEKDSDLSEKILIEDEDENLHEVSDIYLLPQKGGVIIRMGKKKNKQEEIKSWTNNISATNCYICNLPIILGQLAAHTKLFDVHRDCYKNRSKNV